VIVGAAVALGLGERDGAGLGLSVAEGEGLGLVVSDGDGLGLVLEVVVFVPPELVAVDALAIVGANR
jgi:hypothetical protein